MSTTVSVIAASARVAPGANPGRSAPRATTVRAAMTIPPRADRQPCSVRRSQPPPGIFISRPSPRRPRRRQRQEGQEGQEGPRARARARARASRGEDDEELPDGDDDREGDDDFLAAGAEDDEDVDVDAEGDATVSDASELMPDEETEAEAGVLSTAVGYVQNAVANPAVRNLGILGGSWRARSR